MKPCSSPHGLTTVPCNQIMTWRFRSVLQGGVENNHRLQRPPFSAEFDACDSNPMSSTPRPRITKRSREAARAARASQGPTPTATASTAASGAAGATVKKRKTNPLGDREHELRCAPQSTYGCYLNGEHKPRRPDYKKSHDKARAAVAASRLPDWIPQDEGGSCTSSPSTRARVGTSVCCRSFGQESRVRARTHTHTLCRSLLHTHARAHTHTLSLSLSLSLPHSQGAQ